MFNKLKNVRFFSVVLGAILLLAVLAGGLYVAYRQVTDAVRSECDANLNIAAEQFTGSVHAYFTNQEEQMQALASLVAQLPDIHDRDRVVPLLKAFNKDSLARHTQVLYPDVSVYRDTGERQDLRGEIDYARESKKGVHVSDDMISFLMPGRRTIRIFAPVVQQGQVVAMTYNTVYLDEMQNYFKADIYRGKAQLFIIDGNTGHYLMDNWHKDFSQNIEALRTRTYDQGYTADAFLQDLKTGKPGITIFRSKSSGEYLYTHYRPIGINNWQGVVSVQEPDAMRLAWATHHYLTNMAIIYIIAFVIFLSWVLYLRHLAIQERERLWRLDMNTGLENRNAYTEFLTAFTHVPGQVMTVVYVDVNGLHEMNNRFGHEAGDKMLCAVADTLKKTLPQAALFRIGGDEFLAAQTNINAAAATAKMELAQQELAKQGYYISVGVEEDTGGRILEEVVWAADQKMLAAKRQYYCTVGNRRRREE
jgi:diguanylate cyclase (GGDEF)-like protein